MHGMEATEPGTDAPFRTVRKGFDPAEVQARIEQLRADVAAAEERAAAAERRATDIEAAADQLRASGEAALERAREQAAAVVAEAESTAASRLAETEERVATWRAEGERARQEAWDEAAALRAEVDDYAEGTRAAADGYHERTVREADEEARAAAEAVLTELGAHRDELQAEIDLLDRHLATQRRRLAEVAAVLQRLVDDPDALGSVAGIEPLVAAAPVSAEVPAGDMPTLTLAVVPADEDVDIAGELAALADDPMIDENLAREFFEEGPYEDPHWAGRQRRRREVTQES
jgi:hypothetical protein